ncbi:MAG TPA: TonB-dependent receptor plug domain-containing protein, partial [Chthoniobacterales bacterium]
MKTKIRPFDSASRRARRTRVCILFIIWLGSASSYAQGSATPTPSLGRELSAETQADPVIVSATRTDIPLSESPASVTVVSAEDMEQKQIERVSDALREVPGLAVVQTGTAGQLTSVFTRGLASDATQVLLNGIPINQGLAGQFDFANLTNDDIDRIEVVRGPQSTLYGPRALAGVIQLFTKRGEGIPEATISSEGGSYGTFRESLESDGKIDSFDYSIGASRIDTDNARPNNQYRNTNAIADVGWSPDKTVRIGA